MEKEIENKEGIKKDSVLIVLIAVLGILVLFNQYQILGIFSSSTGFVTSTTSKTQVVTVSSVIPTGTPNVYGGKLGVSFDDVTPYDKQRADAAISRMAMLDREITLTGDNLQRYIDTVSQISCEYCCGAKSIIFDDGRPACGCAHSYAMRGLAKYLIKNHGAEYTNDQILEELGKWKTLFFPTQMSQKAQVLQDKGIELNYINLASNKYRGIEKGVSGGMVGGC